MKRYLLLVFVIILGVAFDVRPASAHLTGVFAYFVKDINEPTASTRMLRQQLDSVTKRIAALEPEVRRARAEYDLQAEAAVRRIRFYDVYAGSALGALWAGAQDPIDVLASTESLQKNLAEDLDALARLADSYQQLRGQERSLRRYADLLVPFQRSAEAREKRLSNVAQGLMSPFAEPYIAYRIAEDWETMRGSTFVLYFYWVVHKIMAQGLDQVLQKDNAAGTVWRLDEEILNVLVGGDGFPFIEGARFYLRADHVNFSARMRSARDTYELLTIGQIERTGPFGVQYRIEAIFVDGMPIDPNDPDVQREIYRGHLLGLNLSSLVPNEAEVATFEQQNGSVRFQFQ